jgi:hypothetical protein
LVLDVWWSASDGTNSVTSTYADIDRNNFDTFELMLGENVLVSVLIPEGEASRFVYRRRTRMMVGGLSRVQHLFGFSDGDVWCYDESMGCIWDGVFGAEHEHADFGWPIWHEHEGEASF